MPIGCTRNQTAMELFNVPISMIRQYVFCPRIPYFLLLLELKAPGGSWIKQGLSFHDRSAMLSKRRKLCHYGLSKTDWRFVSDISLFDADMGMHGICDGVIYTKDELCPLEFKLSSMKTPAEGAVLQLTAYAMLLEKKESQPVKRGFILVGNAGKTFEIEFIEQRRAKVMKICQEIRGSCEKALFPNSSATNAQCCQCEYLNFCADRL